MGDYPDQSPWWDLWLFWTFFALFLLANIALFREAWRHCRSWWRRRQQLKHLRKFGR